MLTVVDMSDNTHVPDVPPLFHEGTDLFYSEVHHFGVALELTP
jgi:hypothetical protein